MKYVLSLVIALIAIGTGSAQLTTEQYIDREMNRIEEALSAANPNLLLNKNQKALLENVLKEKAEKVISIREKGILTREDKLSSSVKLEDINKRYETKIERLLTDVQRIAYIKERDRLKRGGITTKD